MNRREFLKYSVAFASGVYLNSCAHLTSRYVKPDRVTLSNEKLIIKNARIIDVRNGNLFQERNLLLIDGRIIKLIKDPDKSGIVADRTIDLSDAFLMPGLINSHVHMTLPCCINFKISMLTSLKRQIERNAEECIKHGVTTVRDMLSALDYLTDLKDKIYRGEIVGPRIISCCVLQVSGGYLNQFSLFSEEKYWNYVSNPQNAREAVKRAVDLGADFIKLFYQETDMYLPGGPIPTMDVQTMRTICDEASRHNKIVAMHHTSIQGLDAGIQGGINSFEHMACDSLISDDQIKQLLGNESYIVPTSTVGFSMSFEKRGDPNWGKGQTLRMMNLRKELQNNIFKDFCEPEIYDLNCESFKDYSDPSSFERFHLFYWLDPKIHNAELVNGSYNLTRLYNAGVKFGCGNDGGVPFIFPGAMPLEMLILEKNGLKVTDIIKMATINNARLLGLENEIGSIDHGKKADIVIYEKNPLISVENIFHPQMVFKDGQLIYRNV